VEHGQGSVRVAAARPWLQLRCCGKEPQRSCLNPLVPLHPLNTAFQLAGTCSPVLLRTFSSLYQCESSSLSSHCRGSGQGGGGKGAGRVERECRQ